MTAKHFVLKPTDASYFNVLSAIAAACTSGALLLIGAGGLLIASVKGSRAIAIGSAVQASTASDVLISFLSLAAAWDVGRSVGPLARGQAARPEVVAIAVLVCLAAMLGAIATAGVIPLLLTLASSVLALTAGLQRWRDGNTTDPR